MTFEICTDGRRYIVHTEVGNGLTRVVVEETDAPEASIDCSEEA
jgi:hypothetical protein